MSFTRLPTDEGIIARVKRYSARGESLAGKDLHESLIFNRLRAARYILDNFRGAADDLHNRLTDQNIEMLCQHDRLDAVKLIEKATVRKKGEEEKWGIRWYGMMIRFAVKYKRAAILKCVLQNFPWELASHPLTKDWIRLTFSRSLLSEGVKQGPAGALRGDSCHSVLVRALKGSPLQDILRYAT